MQPPFGPNIIDIGPLQVRWYAVCILAGAMLGAWLGSYRARARGYAPNHAWDGLMLGLILGILGGRIWYVISAWPTFEGRNLLYILNPQSGGLAIHGAIIGAMLTVVIYSTWHKLNILDWFDILAPCLSVGQAIGRWGNFFNREAYGGPVDNGLPWNLHIPAAYRISGTSQYPEDTRFHPTFLYESLWNVGVLVAIVWIEQRWGKRLRRGDSLLIYGILYSIGRFWIEALRVDKLCTTGIKGIACEGGLSTARLTSIVAIVVCAAILAGRRLARPNPPQHAYQPLDRPWVEPTTTAQKV